MCFVQITCTASYISAIMYGTRASPSSFPQSFYILPTLVRIIPIASTQQQTGTVFRQDGLQPHNAVCKSPLLSSSPVCFIYLSSRYDTQGNLTHDRSRSGAIYLTALACVVATYANSSLSFNIFLDIVRPFRDNKYGDVQDGISRRRRQHHQRLIRHHDHDQFFPSRSLPHIHPFVSVMLHFGLFCDTSPPPSPSAPLRPIGPRR
jgi:hypothetical protein